jgi:NtrC-family two-component system response regulator AlgB
VVSAPMPAATSINPKIVARDEVARRMFEIALRAAPSNVAILILGETGTGKNLLAQTIHDQSPLKSKPFVTVNCPSLNKELLESDLFGHVRGAFTGAVQDTWGKVAAAEGGTLFLDEIGDLPANLQPKLLRLLQEKQYERVGETTPRSANVRIIAATNRDLKSEVAAGRFREDLFYRLNVITLEVPPLRCRPNDIIAAAEMFLDTICRQLGKRVPTFTPEARRLLEAHAWPGNLRELRNVIERAAVLSENATLDLNDFPTLVARPSVPQYQVGASISLHALETAHIQMVVAKSATLEEAARILEIDKSTLYRKRKAMEGRVADFASPTVEPSTTTAAVSV